MRMGLSRDFLSMKDLLVDMNKMHLSILTNETLEKYEARIIAILQDMGQADENGHNL